MSFLSRSWSFAAVAAICLAVAGTSMAQRNRNTPRDPDLVYGSLVAIDEVQLPATDAGILTQILVEEGDSVSEKQTLVQIDDRDAVMAMQIAAHQYQSAKAQAENRISVEAAQKSHEVARAELDTAVEANRKVPGTFSETEVRRLRLTWQRAGLQIDLARHEMHVAALDARARLAQYEQAKAMIERRKLTAPHDGIVVRVYRHKGDWVQPGDAVMHLVRMNELRALGNFPADRYHWKDLLGKEVEVTVHLPSGRVESQRAKVGFASPVVQDDNTFRIWAMVKNRKEDRFWVLGPGLDVTIRLIED